MVDDGSWVSQVYLFLTNNVMSSAQVCTRHKGFRGPLHLLCLFCTFSRLTSLLSMPGTHLKKRKFLQQLEAACSFFMDLVNSSPTIHLSVKLFMRWNISMSGSPIADWLNIDRLFKKLFCKVCHACVHGKVDISRFL